ncbi:uncharacterized protein EURHEDRAFT_348961 [Aspergillus ruber CBS 135680]|uniref:Uncharacterized protein n=1 Tax=Aspergillus ruber (strain CBS 135680) TaxID=1388766 RepID=A0A017RZH5_ASPRC|nr:uncharacterized protein EURHEDRAFT_348961 [Aspergillus ruber CBS 135680]EYE89981.1 hypothetical protein EURHEDRAFT_348961 [Aspergillus ruber CBS 135680]
MLLEVPKEFHSSSFIFFLLTQMEVKEVLTLNRNWLVSFSSSSLLKALDCTGRVTVQTAKDWDLCAENDIDADLLTQFTNQGMNIMSGGSDHHGHTSDPVTVFTSSKNEFTTPY